MLIESDYSAPREIIDNKRQILYLPFVCEFNRPYEDINFASIIPDSITEIVAYYDKLNVPRSDYLDMFILFVDFFLTRKVYIIEWDTYHLMLENPIVNKNYHLGLYLDMSYAERYKQSKIQPTDSVTNN